MDNRNDKNAGQNQGQGQGPFTDQGEDSEQRREAADKAWQDRAGVPRGTPAEGESGEKSTDDVGSSKTAQPGREVEDESTGPGQKRAPDVDDIDEKR